MFVTSFTFQAPGFYERHGYREIFRWDGVPTADAADVHLRKDLSPAVAGSTLPHVGHQRRPASRSAASRHGAEAGLAVRPEHGGHRDTWLPDVHVDHEAPPLRWGTVVRQYGTLLGDWRHA